MHIIFNSNVQFRRLAHGLSLFFSIIMGIMLLVTSSLMANIYVKYCDFLKDYDYDYSTKCGEDERPFVILPLFGYFTMIIWVRCL